MSLLFVECSRCNLRTFLPTSKNMASPGRSDDVNRRAVHFVLKSGICFSGLETFCVTFNQPCMAETSYNKQWDIIAEVAEEEADCELKEAGFRLRNLLRSENSHVINDSVEDIAVSFDGTWAKRGHTSLYGVVFVLSVDTGEVLDYCIMSKFCKACSMWESKKNQTHKNIAGKGHLTEAIIKKIQWYYGLAIQQNVLKITNPTANQKQIAVYQMKKKHYGYTVTHHQKK